MSASDDIVAYNFTHLFLIFLNPFSRKHDEDEIILFGQVTDSFRGLAQLFG
jgi:hypothetical protein